MTVFRFFFQEPAVGVPSLGCWRTWDGIIPFGKELSTAKLHVAGAKELNKTWKASWPLDQLAWLCGSDLSIICNKLKQHMGRITSLKDYNSLVKKHLLPQTVYSKQYHINIKAIKKKNIKQKHKKTIKNHEKNNGKSQQQLPNYPSALSSPNDKQQAAAHLWSLLGALEGGWAQRCAVAFFGSRPNKTKNTFQRFAFTNN